MPEQAGTVDVEIEGLGTVKFPASMSDDEIRAAIARVPPSAFKTSAEPTPTAASAGAPPAGRPDPMVSAQESLMRFGGGVGDAINPMPLLRQVGGAAVDEEGPQAGFRKMAVGMGEGIAAGSREMDRKAMEKFSHAAGSSGLDRILSGIQGAGYSVAGAIPVLGPAAAGVGERIGGGDIAGGLGEAFGLAGGGIIGRAAGGGAQALARPAARALLGTAAPGVAEAALKYRALPGLVRSGPNRTGRRMAAAQAGAQRAVSRAEQPTPPSAGITEDLTRGIRQDLFGLQRQAPGRPVPVPVNLRRSPKRNQAWDEIRESFTEEADKVPARGIAETHGLFAQSNPTAGKALSRAQATQRRVMGDTGPRGLMGRAVAEDTRAGVARAVPRAGTDIAEIDALTPVAEAYAAKPGHVLPTEGLPDLNTRLLVSTLNRLAGPSTQGLHTAGMAIDPLVRAAIIDNLLRRGSATPDASE